MKRQRHEPETWPQTIGRVAVIVVSSAAAMLVAVFVGTGWPLR